VARDLVSPARAHRGDHYAGEKERLSDSSYSPMRAGITLLELALGGLLSEPGLGMLFGGASDLP
jgi:hypothetical protein